MQTIILILHVLIASALVVVVLLQRSEGGALGIGGGSSSGMFTARGAANILTRATALLAAAFIATSLILAILSGRTSSEESIFDRPVSEQAGQAQDPDAPLAPLSE